MPHLVVAKVSELLHGQGRKGVARARPALGAQDVAPQRRQGVSRRLRAAKACFYQDGHCCSVLTPGSAK
jgi:hypothetical protein